MHTLVNVRSYARSALVTEDEVECATSFLIVGLRWAFTEIQVKLPSIYPRYTTGNQPTLCENLRAPPNKKSLPYGYTR
jgi:hypothetical protein